MPCPAAGVVDRVRCVALLTWQQCLLGVVVPVLVAGWTAPLAPPTELPSEHPQPRAMAPARGGAAAAATRVWRGLAALAGGVARLDAALQAACRGTGVAALQLGLACCLLCSNLWGLAKGAALRSPAAGGGLRGKTGL